MGWLSIAMLNSKSVYSSIRRRKELLTAMRSSVSSMITTHAITPRAFWEGRLLEILNSHPELKPCVLQEFSLEPLNRVVPLALEPKSCCSTLNLLWLNPLLYCRLHMTDHPQFAMLKSLWMSGDGLTLCQLISDVFHYFPMFTLWLFNMAMNHL